MKNTTITNATTETRSQIMTWAKEAFRADLPVRSYAILDFACKFADDESVEEFANWLFGDDRNYENPKEYAIENLMNGNGKFSDHFDAEATAIIAEEAQEKVYFTDIDVDIESGEPVDEEETILAASEKFWGWDLNQVAIQLGFGRWAIYHGSDYVGLLSGAVRELNS